VWVWACLTKGRRRPTHTHTQPSGNFEKKQRPQQQQRQQLSEGKKKKKEYNKKRTWQKNRKNIQRTQRKKFLVA